MAFVEILFSILAIGLCSIEGFKDYRLIRISANQPEEIQWLRDFQQNVDVDVWKVFNSSIDVVLSPESFSFYKDEFKSKGLDYKILNNNLEESIEIERRSMARVRRSTRITNKFASYSEIISWISSLANSNPQLLTTYDIGRTSENRVLKVLKFSTNSNTQKRAIWIDCGIHAREWIAISTCNWIIDTLLNNYESRRSNEVAILDKYDIHILPIVNPDGYEYSRNYHRLWRKNRSRSGSSSCVGVDLNRNNGYYWNTAGSSMNPCSDVYAGPYQDSELETKAVQSALKALSGRWDAFLTIHTYGQLWLTPWGYSKAYPSDYYELVNKAQIGAQALRAVHGTSFTVGTAANVLSAASGGSDDWAKAVGNIKYSYTLELRPSFYGSDSVHGFVLPLDRAPLVGQETYAGIMAFLKAL